ncbi:MAG TPA: hypothetical protein VF701_01805 [Thermoanaerobaculia bacterium]
MIGNSPAATDHAPDHSSGPPSSGAVRWSISILLALVVLASTASYLTRLGFSSDDWSFLALMQETDGSIPDLIRTLLGTRAGADLRFVQVLVLALLHAAFGLAPLGYHLAIAGVLVLTALLVWILFEELTGSRAFALAVSLAFIFLPHYATVRFWMAAIQIPIAVALLLFALYAMLRILRSRRKWWLWLTASAAAVIGSGFSYETPLPLSCLAPLFVWLAVRHRRLSGERPPVRAAYAASVMLIVLAMGMLTLKSTIGDRISGSGSFASQAIENAGRALGTGQHPASHGLELRRATTVAFGLYGVLLPESAIDAWRAARPGTLLLGLVIVVAIAVAVCLLVPAARSRLPDRVTLLFLMVTGVLIFLLGHAVFLFNRGVLHTPTGLGNRTAMAAALGVALFISAFIALLISMLPRPLHRTVFAGASALVCAFGLATIVALAELWIDARHQAESVVERIAHAGLPLGDGTILIAGGFCPYVGPAVVFDAHWDIEGALRIRLGSPSLRADVVTSRMAVEEEGLVANVAYRRRYPYTEPLLFFDVSTGETSRISDHVEAAKILERAHYRRCGVSHPGAGVSILTRDRFPLTPQLLLAVEPASTDVGEPFNLQPDGRSAFIARAAGADPGTRVTIDGLGLPTVVASPSLLSATLPPDILEQPGSYEIRLDNGYSVSAPVVFEVRSKSEE